MAEKLIKLADGALSTFKVTATDKILGRASAGAGDVEEIACTGAGRALLDDADAAAQRTTLGLGSSATYNLGPSFSVHKNGSDQTYLAGSGWVKVTWGAKLFDTGNYFSLANHRFTPGVAGKYLVSACLHIYTVNGIGLMIGTGLYKNGSPLLYGQLNFIQINGAHNRMLATAIVDANGSTDYFELWGYSAAPADSAFLGGADVTWFTGCRVG